MLMVSELTLRYEKSTPCFMTHQFKRILKFEFEDFISSFFSKLCMLLMSIAQLYLEFQKNSGVGGNMVLGGLGEYGTETTLLLQTPQVDKIYPKSFKVPGLVYYFISLI
jgi:hypothetical protein